MYCLGSAPLVLEVTMPGLFSTARVKGDCVGREARPRL